ncbi:glycosyltransferase family 2 protein [Bacillus sp. FDAARGOS_1420]|uniref:glycosyltransferase family 2 protein n=1 Tax=unclassified Bacillus (in: firmicutes) TaxID=185979 RepID=UPI001C5ABC5D|nr:glycosyltransferase family 2 protein [Bacillus sp. FDAARGOS_1420]MBW3494423.1 glycosyltransferase [Bacillus sp. FDAARGOS_1420]
MRISGQRPLVSFIVSVYNLERYIGACLDSIIIQPFDDYEIVLVNNNSTDRSDAICREYAVHNKQIRYYALTGEPLFGKAVIYGTKKARGQYIHYVDGDDMLAPGAYEEIVKILRNSAPDVLFGRFSTVLEDNVINFTDTIYQTNRINGQSKDQVLKYLTEAQPFNVATWRLIFSRKLREHYNVPIKRLKTPSNIYHDVYISVRTLLSAQLVHYVDTLVYLYRVHSSSITRITPSKAISECFKLLLSLSLLMRRVAKTEQERGFVHVYMEQFRYQLIAALCTMSNEQISESAAEIDKYLNRKDLKDTITPSERNGCSEISTLLSEEATVGLARLQVQYRSIIEQIARKVLAKGGNIYIAPTGHIGLYLKTAFEASGLSFSGFFDNDVQKNGMLADGVPVCLPTAVTKIVDDKPITILIVSGYQNVREELRRQFIGLGIDESDLLFVEF